MLAEPRERPAPAQKMPKGPARRPVWPWLVGTAAALLVGAGGYLATSQPWRGEDRPARTGPRDVTPAAIKPPAAGGTSSVEKAGDGPPKSPPVAAGKPREVYAGAYRSALAARKPLFVWIGSEPKDLGLGGLAIGLPGDSAVFPQRGPAVAVVAPRGNGLVVAGFLDVKDATREKAQGLLDKLPRDAGTHPGAGLNLNGHTASVYSLAFSADGKTLVSGSFDGTVKVWDVATGKERATLRGHGGPVNCVALAEDGTTLASGGSDGIVRLGDPATGKEEAGLRGHTGAVKAVAWAADGRTLASGSDDGTVKLWDAPTRKETATLKGHGGRVRCIALAADGRTLASGGGRAAAGNPFLVKEGIVKLWDVPSGQERANLVGHGGAVVSMAFTPDGTALASGSDDGTVKVWEVATRKERFTLNHRFPVRSVPFTGDGKTLATASGLWTLKLWDVAAAKERAVMDNQHSDHVMAVAVTRDGSLLASGSAEIRLWDVSAVK